MNLTQFIPTGRTSLVKKNGLMIVIAREKRNAAEYVLIVNLKTSTIFQLNL